MSQTTVNVADMFCENCSGKIIRALQARQGVGDIHINPLKRDLFIAHDPSITATDLMDEIKTLGFSPRLEQSSVDTRQDNHSLLRRLGVAGICGDAGYDDSYRSLCGILSGHESGNTPTSVSRRVGFLHSARYVFGAALLHTRSSKHLASALLVIDKYGHSDRTGDRSRLRHQLC